MDDLNNVRWCRLVRAIHQCDRWIRHNLAATLHRHDLNEKQFLLLEACAHSTSHSDQRSLSKSLGQSPSKTSAVVESLNERGLLHLARSAEDRRRQLVTLNLAGNQLYEEVTVETRSLAMRLFHSHTAQELTELIESLERMATHSESQRRQAA